MAPLKEWQVVGGRVRGLWAQFLPAVALLLGLWLYCSGFTENEGQWPFLLCFAGTFLTLPVIGLYYSLVKRALLWAFLWTLLVGVAFPAFLAEGARLIDLRFQTVASPVYPHDLAIVWLFTPIQAALAAIMAGRLHSALKGRSFAVQGTGG